jgi:hypothetical protein
LHLVELTDGVLYFHTLLNSFQIYPSTKR